MQTHLKRYTGYLKSSLRRATLLAALSTLPASAQAAPVQKYVISVGAAAEKVSSGTIWLYSFSWYGLQKIQVAAIHNGLALVPLDAAELKRELDPNPTTDGYVLALQIAEHTWYRTPDISPADFWRDFSSALNSLGRTTALPTGEIELLLRPLSKRHITLLYPDGHPAANAKIALSIYLWNANHCGVHEGLPLGDLHTDKTGAIEVFAPLVPLYLDETDYYEDIGFGPAGVAYSHNFGLKTGPEQDLVLKEKWELTESDDLSQDVELRVLTATGQPRKDVDIWGNWSTNTCGGHDTIGRTDANGIARINVDPTFTDLTLMIDGPYSAGDPKGQENSLVLESDQLRQLFLKHKLTVRW